MKLHTTIEIKASATSVWETLMDFNSHTSWNPFIQKISGDQHEGGRLEIHLVPEKGNKMIFKPTVMINKPAQQFQWLGRLVFPGIFDGRHNFEIKDNGNGTVTFIHSEEFKGLLVPLMKKKLEAETISDFIRMNQALKKRCEGVG